MSEIKIKSDKEIRQNTGAILNPAACGSHPTRNTISVGFSSSGICEYLYSIDEETSDFVPIILLITNTEDELDIASQDKDVAIPFGAAASFPISTAAILNQDNWNVKYIYINCDGFADDEEVVSFGDASVDFLGDNSDTATIAGLGFTVSYAELDQTITIRKTDNSVFSLSVATEVLRLFEWVNTAVSPTAGDRTFIFRVSDSDENNSEPSTLTITVYSPVIIDANGASGGNNRTATFTEGGSAVALLDAAGTVSDDTSLLVITIDGVDNGTYEVVEIDGVDFPIGTDATNTTLTAGSTTFTAQMISGTPAYIVIIKTGGGDIPAADLQTLLRGSTFRSDVGDPVEGDRTFTFSPADTNDYAGTETTTTITVEREAETSDAHTTAQAGNWETPATWTAGVVPGANDTVTITHNVVLNTTRSIGASPATDHATPAIAINTGGNLTIATGATLTCRGDLALRANGVDLTLNPNSHIIFNASEAASPTTTYYKLKVGVTGLGVTTAQLLCNGTAGSRCSISTFTNSGANPNAIITNDGTTKGGKIKATYCDFTDLGSNALYGISTANQSDGDGEVSFINCNFTRTGGLYAEYNLQADDHFILRNCNFNNSIAENGTTKTNHSRVYAFGAMTTGTREVSGNVFDRGLHFQNWDNGDCDNNIFLRGFTSGGFNLAWNSFKGNIYHWVDSAEPAFHGLPDSNYFIKNQSPANGNPAFISVHLTTGCVDCLFEDISGSGYEGGGIRILSNPASPRTYTITGNIMVYNPNGSFGKLVGLHGGSNVTVEIEHNTAISGSSSGSNANGHETGILAYGETYAGHAGMISSLRGNLAYRLASITNEGYLCQQEGQTTTPTDVIDVADYNGKWNLSAGSAGLPNGYYKRNMTAAMFTASTPGANDVNGDPEFVDYTRNLAKWDASLGGPGTAVNALAELAKANTSTHNSAYNVADLMEYIRDGVRPTNPAFETAGPGGTVIGAVPFLDLGGGEEEPSINDNTDLTGFAEWQSDMLSFGNTYATYLANHKDDSYPGDPTYAFDTLLNYTYYDGERVYRNIASYTGNNAWLTAAANARYVYRRWLTAYGHVVPGYWKFTTGLRMAWEANNADATAIASINGLANFGAFSPDTTPLSSMENWTVSRETAYTLINLMDQEAIGGSHRDRLEELLELIIGTDGHFDQWFLGSPPVTLPGDNSGEGDDFTPYQVALSAEALIQYWNEYDQDARILSKLILAANWMWDNTWSDVYGQFYYRTDNPLWDGGSELNLVICPLYWWLYLQTGNLTHKTRGDTAFNQGMPTAFIGNPKQFNQVYRWTPAGLLWRSEASILWG